MLKIKFSTQRFTFKAVSHSLLINTHSDLNECKSRKAEETHWRTATNVNTFFPVKRFRVIVYFTLNPVALLPESEFYLGISENF